ncbi:uncharacterized protein DNG_03495 [Cephalotrichum gorgonifer]|uniref:F-box domain-containing protein n=1 Tax=Cephalotrichum gorgonifer TaxID=2041049 RepID=A0AAE8SU22_9PEZI|nr:uncharacterized protein DNG_03495 [Cephalotrichum gorgonifer]
MMEVDTPAAPEQDGQRPAGQDQQGSSCLIRYLKTKFPLELFLRLTEFTEAGALLNMRLACRELECALLPTFRQRFFAKRHLYLTERSLRRLAAVSDEPRLAGGIVTVSIGLSDSASEDDELMIDSGYDVELLVHGFSNLPNLQNVTVSYGQARTFPHFADILTRDNPRRLLRKLLHSLSRAGCELRAFDMDRHGGTGGGFCLSDLHISDSLLEPFSRPLRPVKNLTLALDPNRGEPPYLMKFLAIPRELDHLRLNLDRDSNQSSPLLDTLAESPPLSLSHLTQLDLGKMTVSTKSLVNFIAAVAKTLTRLSFFRIGLIQVYPPAAPSTPDPVPTGGDSAFVPALLWQFVLKEMAAIPELENLTRFSADCLTERAAKKHVSFLQASAGGDSARSPQVKYTGDYARRFLEDLARDVVVPKVNRPGIHGGPVHGDDDSNEDNDNDDDDEDDDGEGDDSNDDL